MSATPIRLPPLVREAVPTSTSTWVGCVPLSTQCAAVSTHLGAITDPPQNCALLLSGILAASSATCHGFLSIVVSCPPTMRSGLGRPCSNGSSTWRKAFDPPLLAGLSDDHPFPVTSKITAATITILRDMAHLHGLMLRFLFVTAIVVPTSGTGCPGACS